MATMDLVWVQPRLRKRVPPRLRVAKVRASHRSCVRRANERKNKRRERSCYQRTSVSIVH